MCSSYWRCNILYLLYRINHSAHHPSCLGCPLTAFEILMDLLGVLTYYTAFSLVFQRSINYLFNVQSSGINPHLLCIHFPGILPDLSRQKRHTGMTYLRRQFSRRHLQVFPCNDQLSHAHPFIPELRRISCRPLLSQSPDFHRFHRNP